MKNINNLKIYKQPIGSITTKCTIIALVIMSIIISSCGAPGSARSKSRGFSKKNEQSKQKSQNDAIAEFESKLKKDKASDSNADEPEALTQQFDASKRKMPTLREQLNELGARQEGLEVKVNSIEKDVAEIKNSVDVIKEHISGERRSAPIAGLAPARSVNVIESDENSSDDQTTVAERNNTPAPTPKAKVASAANAKKKSVTLKKPQKTNKKSAKKKIAANKPAQAAQVTEQRKQEKPKKESAKPTEKKKDDNSAPTGNLTQAMRYFGAKNYNKAISELNAAVQNTADPAMVNSCNYWLGESYFGLGQFDKSVPYFKKVINSASHQKKAEAYAMLAEAYIRVGQVDSAKREFSALIEKYPKSQYVPRAKKMLQQL